MGWALGGITMASSIAGTTVSATLFLAASAAFTLAEMLHATVSWELSVALASDSAQGAYLGVHGLAQAVQRSMGLLARHRCDLRDPAPPRPRPPDPSPIVSGPGYCE